MIALKFNNYPIQGKHKNSFISVTNRNLLGRYSIKYSYIYSTYGHGGKGKKDKNPDASALYSPKFSKC